ncbi:MAG TPA: cardiolipin synthase ClsB [Methylophilaceae bacterium]|jgi:cardiolipin synthase
MIFFTEHNQIDLLKNGLEYFPALEAAIDGARHEIYLETYIYEADATGVRIGEALKRAALRGVRTHVLLDGFGSRDLPALYVRELQQAGVDVMFYRPKISPWTLKRSRLRRLHRKLVVIDGEVAFVGGINIIDDFNVPRHDAPRIDYAVRVRGELLPQIRTSARRLWRSIAWSHLRRVEADILPPASPVQGRMRAAFVVRDNLLHRRDIEQSYLAAINAARSEILIANAYFVPGLNFRKALVAAARRGVKVRLLLQGKKEYFLMFATHYFYSDFLAAGVQVYEYRKSFMHSKVAVIDHEWATVGSSNIDTFSLLLAREANIVVQDGAFARRLAADIERTIADGAQEILAEDWTRGNYLKRMLSALVYFVVRMFTGLVVQPDRH